MTACFSLCPCPERISSMSEGFFCWGVPCWPSPSSGRPCSSAGPPARSSPAFSSGSWKPQARSIGSVVLPRSSSVPQMMMNVPLMIVALWWHQLASISKASTKAMPPLRPACHIMHWWPTVICWELGSLLNHLMPLEMAAQEEVESARPTRQRKKAMTANFTPRRDCTIAVEAPQRMKTMVSMRCAETSRNSVVISLPFLARCFAP
mmetsp:Transcript_23378/g.73646  ORF Transcript_23378/g.73646 Transcript_23378/m.73646 type:complete len:206 (+) Transcript_23378:288-905(+)